ncbi:hypothetical protein C8Q72DRAFT_961689 [Fomitopsis betulina]|nr:hypothetical protein C8Q72DRAFT_961689 [Fomitopsis betulina]
MAPEPLPTNLSDDDELAEYERSWTRRQPWLQSRGYMLRPRYRPGWIPSWRTTGARRRDCEDSIFIGVYPHVIDATRMSDGKLVMIKCVPTDGLELRIALFLGTPPLSEDPTNHCVPILDTFEDETNPRSSYIVMPLFRNFDDPPFENVEDVLEFGEQLLEVSMSEITQCILHDVFQQGLAFMHKNGIAHRFSSYHSMLFPSGQGVAWPLSRSHFHIQYYYIDFSISVYIPPDAHPKLAVGVFGRDQDPPELSDHIPYDPFKLDIFILGNVLRKSFYAIRLDGQMLAEALRQWRVVRKNLSYVRRWWRLRLRDEPFLLGLGSDQFYLATLGYSLAYWVEVYQQRIQE